MPDEDEDDEDEEEDEDEYEPDLCRAGSANGENATCLACGWWPGCG